MKTTTRNLAIVAGCIVVLGGAVAALALSGGGSGGASSAALSSAIPLISKKSEDVVSMTVKNKKGSYTILAQDTKTPSSSSSGTAETRTYTIKGLDGVSVDTTLTQQTVQDGYNLSATQNLGEMSNPEEFGLKDPQATVEVRYQDGSSHTYKVGSPSATESTAYYISVDDSKNIYVATLDGGIFDNQNYFISKQILAITSSSGENDFTAITLSGKNYAKPIQLTKADKTMQIVSPVKADADTNAMTALQTALATVTANSVEAVKPDAAALKTYGLDQPSAIAEFTVNKGSYKLMIGAKKDDSYYVMLDQSNVVCLVSASSLTSVVQTDAFTLRSKSILLPSIDTVKSIAVTQNGTSSAVNVARTKDETKSTQDTPAYTYKVTGSSGKELAYDTNYKSFYLHLIGLELLEQTDKTPTGTPVYQVEYQYFDKTTKDTIAFYAGGDRRYTAVVNGQVYGNVTSSEVDKMITAWKQLQAEQTVE